MLPAVSTAAFDGHSRPAAFERLAGLGLREIEVAFIRGYTDFDEDDLSEAEARRLRRDAAALALGVRAVSAHMDLGADGAGDMLARRIAFAAESGAALLVTNAGPATSRPAILRRLEEALPRLEAAGIILALENPGHGTGDLIGRGEDGAALMAALDHPRLGLNVDVGNLVTYAGALEPGLSAALPWAVQVHLKDVAEDGPDWRFVPLGEGMVDWRATAAAMARDAPGLPVTIELPLRLHRPGRASPVRAAAPVPLDRIAEALRRSLDAWEGARREA